MHNNKTLTKQQISHIFVSSRNNIIIFIIIELNFLTLFRIAQEYLFEFGITVFCHVRPNVMKILSRVCKCKLYTSVPKANDKDVMLGSCGSFHLTAFDIPPVKKKRFLSNYNYNE